MVFGGLNMLFWGSRFFLGFCFFFAKYKSPSYLLAFMLISFVFIDRAVDVYLDFFAWNSWASWGQRQKSTCLFIKKTLGLQGRSWDSKMSSEVFFSQEEQQEN